RESAQGIKFAGQQLIEIGFGQFGDAHHHGIGGEIAQALAAAADHQSESAQEIKHRHHIHDPQQIAYDDLAESQTQPLRVHHPQAKETFAQSLTAPDPFEVNTVTNRQEEV